MKSMKYNEIHNRINKKEFHWNAQNICDQTQNTIIETIKGNYININMLIKLYYDIIYFSF